MTAIGIDLGTTNSAVATFDPDRDSAKVLNNSEGNTLTRSVVALRERNGQRSILVGRSALQWAKREPKDTILSVKRLMGRDYADEAVALARSRMSYRIVAGEGDDPRAHVKMGDERYTPAQVSTMILSKLKEDATRALGAGNEPTHAVITVPAYFKEAQRAATREAGEQAGFVVKRIIDEPTAAAIAYGLELKVGEQRQVLVYDLGGGTFDISILNAVRDDDGRNHFQVLSFLGDNWLGGDDFEMLIVERIIEWVRENAGTDPSSDLGFLFNAKQHAEAAKMELSQQDEVDIIIPAATRGDGAALIDVDITITRDEFETMIEPLVDKTLDLVRAALDEQNLSPADISDVLLVGGSTLVPKVYRSVEKFFGQGKVRRDVNPMECVALGAGILARTLNGVQCASCGAVNAEDAGTCTECDASLATARPTGTTEIYDVTGQALGIAAVDGGRTDVFVPIIQRNTPYPLSEPMRRSFEATDGKVIRVPVYEGDDPVASHNHEQGVIEFQLEEEIDRRTRVEVAFNFDANRILQVTITVPGTGMQHDVELRTDQPRVSSTQAASLDDEDGQNAREDLMIIQDVAKRFLRQYQEYMDPMQVTKIREHLDQAQQTLVFAEKEACKRMTNLLQSDLFGSGLASQLYIADRVAEQATSDDAREIHTAVAAVRDAYQGGRKNDLQNQQQVLRMMVAQVRQRSDVQEISDAEEFDGLLRTIDGH